MDSGIVGSSDASSEHMSFSMGDNGQLVVAISGYWDITAIRPDASLIIDTLDRNPGVRELTFEMRNLQSWDSGLISTLLTLDSACHARELRLNLDSLPGPIRRLFDLVKDTPQRKGVERLVIRHSLLSRIGIASLGFVHASIQMLTFVGEVSQALFRLAKGKARFRTNDFYLALQDCGPSALPIVTLISVLVGIILAFVGAVQLEQFGAQIYVANLVGLAMSREMGAMMSSVIMTGRTGSAFAAELGTMEVNEELDALKTLGISPIEYLVLPRMLALMLMMPLLTLYSDLMGILGGALVGIGMMDLTVTEYFIQTKGALRLLDFNLGLLKGAVFGLLVAFAGCFYGIHSGRSASAVGSATTSAVVLGIVLIIVFDTLFTFIFDVLGL